jgi:hypothetical protein
MLVQDIAAPAPPVNRWRLATRLAFRFSFAYLGLRVFGFIPPPLITWVAERVFQVTTPLAFAPTGSGDTTVDWLRTFIVLVAAVAVTALWSLLDRRRNEYERLHTWFLLFVRFALGLTMVNYGAIKLIPLQMPAPSLVRLLEPYGNFSPMGVLWSFIGASPAYETFSGAVELLGGLLLFVPRTALFGALVSLAAATHIFVLNMTYDVPVKLMSFHLILYALVLLAPDAGRLVGVLATSRIAARPLGRTPGRRIAWLSAQVGIGTMMAAGSLFGASQSWGIYGGGAPRSPLYGVWNVDEMSIGGAVRPPLLTDQDRWRRVVFDNPSAVSFQRMDERVDSWAARIDTASQSLTLQARAGATVGRLQFERPSPAELTLDGEMDGRQVRMRLQRVDDDAFLLRSRGFHWVQEVPFNR